MCVSPRLTCEYRFLKPVKIIDVLAPASLASQKCLHLLKLVCGARKILPKSYTLSGTHFTIGSQPVAFGAVADIYEGTLEGSKVCVKRTRTYSTSSNADAGTQEVCYPFLTS